jgi:predicted amidohydrolase
VKVAAYQTPLAACRSVDGMIALIRAQIDRCESLGVEFLCCPESALGGLADYVGRPIDIAFDADGARLAETLAPLASETVTTIVGFTEVDRRGRLYNAAAVVHRGAIAGRYRKLHPAINRSVYTAGHETPVFTVGALTFGVVICRDSSFPEPARAMASRGAAALFVPTNNGLPPTKGGPEIVDMARRDDVARAVENSVAVIRADVAGRSEGLVAYGSSAIVGRDGAVLRSAPLLEPDLIVADVQ